MNYSIDTTNNQEVPQGYKKTKVGVIPLEWEVVKVGELCDCIVPGRNKPSNFIGTIPWVTTPDLTDKYISDTKNKLYIDNNEAKKIGSKIVVKDSVIMTCVGEFGIISIVNNDIVINQQLHAFLPSQLIESEFLYYALHTQIKYMDRIATKTAVPYMNKNNCNSIPIPLPPLKEQQKIAKILTTWDDAISKQEKLIKEKEQLKKGLMQKLLSGEVRFDGFRDEWENVKLGDIINILSSKRVLQKDWQDKGIPFYRTREIVNLSNGDKFRAPIFISNKLFESIKNKYGVPKTGDILVTGVGTIGETYIVKENDKFYFKDGNVLWFQIKDNIISKYLSYLFKTRSIKKQLSDNASITTVATFTIEGAKQTIITFPSIEEQQKIAQVLSTADKEIELLKNELESLKEQKKGLMQRLLSGEVRVEV